MPSRNLIFPEAEWLSEEKPVAVVDGTGSPTWDAARANGRNGWHNI